MIRKATFTMEKHSVHVHSTRFNTLKVSDVEGTTQAADVDIVKLERFNTYIPKPLADGARKIRVTIEVIE